MSMGKFLIKRTLIGIPLLVTIIFITFMLIRATPGGPFETTDKMTDALRDRLNAQYGLDRPPLEQFVAYMGGVLRLDFGPSLGRGNREENVQVTEIIAQRLPISVQVGIYAVSLGYLIGIPLGVLAALYRNTAIDYGATFFAVLGASIPSLVLGPMLIIVFAVGLNWLPVADVNGIWARTLQDPGVIFSWDYISLAILPVFTLGVGMSAGIARLTRASLLQVLREDYIRTARAKGLRERVVIYGHALKNSLIPVVTSLGALLAAILTGTFIVERIFNIPGLGREFVNSVTTRDYNLLVGATALYSLFLISGNILVDVMYTWLDPRIRFN